MYIRAATRIVVETMHPMIVKIKYGAIEPGSVKVGITFGGGVRPGFAGAVMVYICAIEAAHTNCDSSAEFRWISRARK